MTSLFVRVSELLGEPVQAPPRPAPRPPSPPAPPTPTPEPDPRGDAISSDEEMSLAEGLGFCLGLETDQETQLTCVAYMVAEPEPNADPNCPNHLIMLTQPGCVYCDRARHRYDGLFKEGLIQEVDLHSERGKLLAVQAGIDFTPGLVVVGCDDRLRASLDNALHPRIAWHEEMGASPPSIPTGTEDAEDENLGDGAED